jgi:hypothetical protein
MTTDSNHIPEKKAGRMRPLLDGILSTIRETPLRMPAEGWFSEVTTNEDWRTTTIVRRHRDQAVMIPPS